MIYLGSAQVLTVPLPPEDYVKLYQVRTTLVPVSSNLLLSADAGTLDCLRSWGCLRNCEHRDQDINSLLLLPDFYNNIFQKQAIIVGTLCICWYIASVLVTLLQCIPAHKVWNKTAPGKCLDLATFVLGYEITNAFLDVALIVMAVRMIHTLQLKRGQKILISSIFMLGGL